MGTADSGHHVRMPHYVFLTGATGFVGMETLARLLERPGREVVALIRADDNAGAHDRLEDVLGRLGLGHESGRVHAVAGDVTQDGLGLAPDEREAIAARVDAVVHCAASVSFALPLPESREINVEGTRRVLELALEAPELERFVHVSTAYVAGTYPGEFGEDEHDRGQDFRNAYEQSKWEAEGVVRAADGLPLTVVRPSIVVGDSETGWTAAFNVLYHPLKAYARGQVDTIPADPDSIVDVVPVDFVADGILAALDAPEPLATLALVAGECAPRLVELTEAAARYFELPPPALEGEPPAELEAFLPYFTVATRFDDANARAFGLEAPRIEDYFDRLMDFAVAAQWGKREVPRRPTTARSAPAA